jgi:hypothetical protein
MKTAVCMHRRSSLGSAAAVSCAALLCFSAADAASLATAARAGDASAVRGQLAAGADANQVESDGSSALLWAAYHSSPELVALLLASHADPNRANEFGVTPLLQASRNGDVDTMRALLDGGADVAQAVREGETPLMAAARTGNEAAVHLLLEQGSDPNAAETLEGQTALMGRRRGTPRYRRRAAQSGRGPESQGAHVGADEAERSHRLPERRRHATHVGGAGWAGSDGAPPRRSRRRHQSDERRRRDRDDARDRQRSLRHGRDVAHAWRGCERRLALVRDRDA